MRLLVETITLILFVGALFVGYIVKSAGHDSIGLAMFVTALTICVISVFWNPRPRNKPAPQA